MEIVNMDYNYKAQFRFNYGFTSKAINGHFDDCYGCGGVDAVEAYTLEEAEEKMKEKILRQMGNQEGREVTTSTIFTGCFNDVVFEGVWKEFCNEALQSFRKYLCSYGSEVFIAESRMVRGEDETVTIWFEVDGKPVDVEYYTPLPQAPKEVDVPRKLEKGEVNNIFSVNTND